MVGRIRDLAMFNLAIDSKLRGCDVVNLKVEVYYPSGKQFLLRFKEKGGKEKALPRLSNGCFADRCSYQFCFVKRSPLAQRHTWVVGQ